MRRIISLTPMKFVIVLALAGCAIGIGLGINDQPSTFKHPPFQISAVHAQTSDPTSGCAVCHTQPITGTCTSCHASPPKTIRTIYFPHHDTTPGGPPDSCQNTACHNGATDMRYVATPAFTQSYCNQCHTLEHSTL